MPDRSRTTTQPCPQPILLLIERFDQHRETYQRETYNETQVRREFIDPFFKSLGWDVDNESGHAEAYKDVIHEDAIKVGGSTKAPDYCFSIGGERDCRRSARVIDPSMQYANIPRTPLQGVGEVA